MVLREGVRAILGDPQVPGAYWIAELDDVVVGQLMITFEWSDWRNRMIWWIQSVDVSPAARQHGVFRALYRHVRDEAKSAGAGGLRLYADTTNTRAQQVYAALGMNGDHYRVSKTCSSAFRRGFGLQAPGFGPGRLPARS